MLDSECVHFLQWALPQLHMRWAGFRKVHKRVCKRLAERLSELNLPAIDAYHNYLTQQPSEWHHLDTLCRVVITRFYRDKQVFAELTNSVLPKLASNVISSGSPSADIWSIGSASGEEPYTIAILWHHLLTQRFPQVRLKIIGTEIAPSLIERSRRACYARGSLKNLPNDLCSVAFTMVGGNFCLKQLYRDMVQFLEQDIRSDLPDNHFDMILCRNLVFTYFDESLQRTCLDKIISRLKPGGWLLLGVHEKLPDHIDRLQAISDRLGFYQLMD